MKTKKPGRWLVSIRVKGSRPDVRTLCGDTVFVAMKEGQAATWTIKREKRKKERK